MNNRIGIYFAYWTHEWDADFIYYINKVARLGFDTLEICPGNEGRYIRVSTMRNKGCEETNGS